MGPSGGVAHHLRAALCDLPPEDEVTPEDPARVPSLDWTTMTTFVQHGPPPRAGVLRLLPGLLLLIVGLLGMHVLGLHGTPVAHAAPCAVAAGVVPHESASHDAVAGADLGHAAGGHSQDGAAGHLHVAMTCVFLLLLAMSGLVPPRIRRSWIPRTLRAVAAIRPGATAVPCAPSLHVLCISRT